MSVVFFKKMVITIFVLIILINTVIASMLFKAAGYKLFWEKEESKVVIVVTEVSLEKKETNYNKININIKKGILEVFENIFIKERDENKTYKIQ